MLRFSITSACFFLSGMKTGTRLCFLRRNASLPPLRINLNIQGCSVVAPSSHAPFHAPLVLPLLLSHNIPLPRVHSCVMGRLVHTGLGS